MIIWETEENMSGSGKLLFVRVKVDEKKKPWQCLFSNSMYKYLGEVSRDV